MIVWLPSLLFIPLFLNPYPALEGSGVAIGFSIYAGFMAKEFDCAGIFAEFAESLKRRTDKVEHKRRASRAQNACPLGEISYYVFAKGKPDAEVAVVLPKFALAAAFNGEIK